jgi:hypothetical protein
VTDFETTLVDLVKRCAVALETLASDVRPTAEKPLEHPAQAALDRLSRPHVCTVLVPVDDGSGVFVCANCGKRTRQDPTGAASEAASNTQPLREEGGLGAAAAISPQSPTTAAAVAAPPSSPASTSTASGDIAGRPGVPNQDGVTRGPEAVSVAPPTPSPGTSTTHGAELAEAVDARDWLTRALGERLAAEVARLGDAQVDESLAADVRQHGADLLGVEAFTKGVRRIGVKKGAVPNGALLRRVAIEVVLPEIERRVGAGSDLL